MGCEMIEDITGMRSGKLDAVQCTDEKQNGLYYWICRCDCGKEVKVLSSKIRSGSVTSCGCSRSGRPARDLTGQRFGKLTALYRLNEKKGTCYLWRCRCDCGSEVDVSVNSLTTGNTTSCGCARRDALRNNAIDLSGRRFGRLTALYSLSERKQGGVVWRCCCDCGNEIDASYNSLVTGNTQSCGCMKREHAAPPLHYVDGTCVEMLGKQKLRRDNTSGYTGVVKTASGWHAQITFKKKTYHLGTYSLIDDAIKARAAAEEELHGSFLEWYRNEFRGGETVASPRSAEWKAIPAIRGAAGAD